ncbi:MAG: transcription antitermination factor NusB [Candidatus Saccharimonadales bacterium]|jgi:N utilization substance protein B
MSANRHLGRIVALQTLYEQDFRRECEDKDLVLDEVLARNIGRYSETIDDKTFIEKLVHGVEAHQKSLDDIIRPVAPEWPIEQIARMDRIILRIGVYELTFERGVPPKVVINEAVELAKAFGGDNSSKFVNGVLGTVLRNLEAAAKKTKKTTRKPTKAKKE